MVEWLVAKYRFPFSVYFLLNGCSKNEKKRETFLMNLNTEKIFFIFIKIKMYHRIVIINS